MATNVEQAERPVPPLAPLSERVSATPIADPHFAQIFQIQVEADRDRVVLGNSRVSRTWLGIGTVGYGILATTSLVLHASVVATSLLFNLALFAWIFLRASRQVRFDRRADILEIRSWAGVQNSIPLADVVGLQLCPGQHQPSSSPLWQLNLVVEGENDVLARRSLLQVDEPRTLTKLAHQLAELAKLPLIDQSGRSQA